MLWEGGRKGGEAGQLFFACWVAAHLLVLKMTPRTDPASDYPTAELSGEDGRAVPSSGAGVSHCLSYEMSMRSDVVFRTGLKPLR